MCIRDRYIESGEANTKWKIPENWPYKEARELFLNPDVIKGSEIDLKWSEPKEQELVDYMCKEKGFNEERIRSGIKRLQKGLKTGIQGRLDGFFKVKPKTKAQLAEAAAKAKSAKKAGAKNKVTKPRR